MRHVRAEFFWPRLQGLPGKQGRRDVLGPREVRNDGRQRWGVYLPDRLDRRCVRNMRRHGDENVREKLQRSESWSVYLRLLGRRGRVCRIGSAIGWGLTAWELQVQTPVQWSCVRWLRRWILAQWRDMLKMPRLRFLR